MILFFHLVFTSLIPRNVYNSSLSKSNQIYSRICDKKNFYYESIQVKVFESGYYSIRSYGNMDAYGLIYRNTFNPLKPSENLFQTEDDSSLDDQFRFDLRLDSDITYVLVVTTYLLKEIGLFSIIVQGPKKVILERLSEYISIYIV